MSRRFAGYDPGGDGAHGVADLIVDDSGRVVHVQASDVQTADDALSFLYAGTAEQITTGVGVDTLTEWCLGPSGWRPADVWLRQTYPTVANSVASPNSLFGAMGLNGMGVLVALRAANPHLVVSETHPKLLYFDLTKQKYDWETAGRQMSAWLTSLLGIPVTPTSGHAFDALLSAWACANGVIGRWHRDLHQPIVGLSPRGRMVRPVGSTNYFWP
jgi:hypothetical protein